MEVVLKAINTPSVNAMSGVDALLAKLQKTLGNRAISPKERAKAERRLAAAIAAKEKRIPASKDD